MSDKTNGIARYHALFGTEIHDPRVMFEMLTVNVFQPGLNWRIAASKLPVFDRVFKHFDVYEIAKFDEPDFEKIEADPEMIRNPRKIRAVVQNARAVLNLSLNLKIWPIIYGPSSLRMIWLKTRWFRIRVRWARWSPKI
ncbi:DNA-3-methyladenine glycosylase [Lentilactobacillus farraginis DSM 18382 = JCM 14108]|uniref:DNA-3-methyladenine glycosylase n=1 Tax=Lentilactobacillus farraginis DSM 18382 = JCM 14108 TaxID=1423743 RepID=X0QC05_9LACO|nr:DNA-3-methyladenine glycosylase [Lentilactobacillus farraginis DSM 18382 = JCM 14108]